MIIALAVTGPTASGKTSLSLELARRFNCEIVSCDSMQIYRGMDIGTAKATAEERALIPHHLIDILSPTESYSAESYRRDALRASLEITARGRLPLFVGGTGLYIDTVIRGGEIESPESDPAVRAMLLREAETEEGALHLWERLRAVDPESAEKIHKNNVRRVVRALEIYEATGMTKTHFDELSRQVSRDISVGMITLDVHNRDNLYGRVDGRVELMMSEGLVDEARSLYESGLLLPDTTASQAIGYKELVAYFKGECTLSEAKEQIKLSSRRYAKRQLTWFRRNKDARRIYLDGEDGVMKNTAALTEEAVTAAKSLLAELGG